MIRTIEAIGFYAALSAVAAAAVLIAGVEFVRDWREPPD